MIENHKIGGSDDINLTLRSLTFVSLAFREIPITTPLILLVVAELMNGNFSISMASPARNSGHSRPFFRRLNSSTLSSFNNFDALLTGIRCFWCFSDDSWPLADLAASAEKAFASVRKNCLLQMPAGKRAIDLSIILLI